MVDGEPGRRGGSPRRSPPDSARAPYREAIVPHPAVGDRRPRAELDAAAAVGPLAADVTEVRLIAGRPEPTAGHTVQVFPLGPAVVLHRAANRPAR